MIKNREKSLMTTTICHLYAELSSWELGHFLYCEKQIVKKIFC